MEVSERAGEEIEESFKERMIRLKGDLNSEHLKSGDHLHYGATLMGWKLINDNISEQEISTLINAKISIEISKNKGSVIMEKLTEKLVNWVDHWFATNGNKNTKAVIGISGGKDSSVVAALCCRALGPERVLGVLMPCGNQADIVDSYSLINHLGIKSIQVNIGPMYETSLDMIQNAIDEIDNPLVKGNLQSRLRMSTLYAVSQEVGGRVSNNCNKSERFVGYSTLYGDNAGDFAPLANLTVREVMEVGQDLGLPTNLSHKTPIDGLENNKAGALVLTDEDAMGFTYDEIEEFVNFGVVKGKPEITKSISEKHNCSEFKRAIVQIPCFEKSAERTKNN